MKFIPKKLQKYLLRCKPNKLIYKGSFSFVYMIASSNCAIIILTQHFPTNIRIGSFEAKELILDADRQRIDQ